MDGYDFVWENPSHELFKANYIRDKATDTLINVRIEYDSPLPEDTPSAVYKEFEQWFTSCGVVPEVGKTDHTLLSEIGDKLLEFDMVTNNKVLIMRKTSALRPPASEKYIQAFIDDRARKRKKLELKLRKQYGLD